VALRRVRYHQDVWRWGSGDGGGAGGCGHRHGRLGVPRSRP
jgi:hypothetical protein